MYFIIETKEQFQQFSKYDIQECFIEPILLSDNVHPILSEVSAFYIKPHKSKRGFILPINHSETFSLDLEDVLNLFREKTKIIYTSDGKRTKYHLDVDKPIICLKTLKWLETGEVIDDSQWCTSAHNFLNAKYSTRTDVNRLIPIAKHQQRWNAYVNDNKKLFSSKLKGKGYFKFYNELVPDVLARVEAVGLRVDQEALLKHYPETNLEFICGNNKVHGWYNIHTATGRPSNTFAGINFAAMNKSDNSREFIVSGKGLLVEFDYHSYHPRILAYLVGYKFPGEDIHTHLGQMYFDTEELTDEQYSQSKNLTFKLLYTGSDEYMHLPFFKAVRAYKEALWQEYRTNGFIPAVLSKRPIRGMESKTQILPYILQSYETEANLLVMKDLQEYLQNKYTKLVMYSYDAFLFQHSKKDGPEVLEDLQAIIESGGYTTSIKVGKEYSDLKQLPG